MLLLCRNCQIFSYLPPTVGACYRRHVIFKSAGSFLLMHTTFFPLLIELATWSLVFSLDSWWTGLIEPSGTIKDGCTPSGAHGTTWAYCLYDERLIHVHGFATAKIKLIHNWAVDVRLCTEQFTYMAGKIRIILMWSLRKVSGRLYMANHVFLACRVPWVSPMATGVTINH